jgi:hypothetical protein
MIKIFKIIYITSHSFSESQKERYGMEYFLDENIEIEVLDITKYVYSNINIPIQKLDDISIYSIDNKEEFIKYITKQNNSNTFFINFAGESNCVILNLLEYLYKTKMIFSTINFGEVPLTESFLRKISNVNISKVIKKIKLKICKKKSKRRIKYPFFISTNKTPNTNFLYKKHIHIHTFDYDLYLNSFKKNKKILNTKYAVFLDINLMFHPDIKLLNIQFKINVDSEEYYKNLDKIFSTIEKKYNLEIVFALHPSFDLLNIKFLYGRKFYLGKTVELVKDSKFCLTHGSTSINFSVLFNKPILFINTKEIKAQADLLNYLNESANILGSDIIDGEKEIQDINIKDIDMQKYEDYIFRYIKNNSSKEYIWKYILSEVEKKMNLNEK